MLSDYLLLECISKGGVADVYRARRTEGENFEVAIKVFRPGYAQRASFREYFMVEADKVGQFDHPNILPFLEYGEGDDLLYLVTPLVTTGTLADLLQRVGGRFSALQALPIVQQLCSAVQYAHEHEVIHGNIKPTNVFVAGDGRMLLADFGIARRYDDSQQSLTRVGWGSAEYAAPEQSLGVLRRGSDIYSLGVLLFKVLTGSTPFTGQTPVEVLLKHVRQQAPSARSFVPSISDAVDGVLHMALQKRSDDRFASAEELSNAYLAAVTVAPVASPVSRPNGLLDPRSIRSQSASPAPVNPQTPIPSFSANLPPKDPVTPVPPSLVFSLPAPPTSTPAAPATTRELSPSSLSLPEVLQQAFPPSSASDVTQVRKKNFLQEPDAKEPSLFWSVDPAEWSPIARDVPGEAQSSVPLSASDYLKHMPLATEGEPQKVSSAEKEVSEVQPAKKRKTLGDHLYHLLPFIVVALLLLGLLMALLSTFLFPTDKPHSFVEHLLVIT